MSPRQVSVIENSFAFASLLRGPHPNLVHFLRVGEAVGAEEQRDCREKCGPR